VLMIEGGGCNLSSGSQNLSHLKTIKKSMYPKRRPRKRIWGMNSKKTYIVRLK
jgi:hypothetical protein